MKKELKYLWANFYYGVFSNSWRLSPQWRLAKKLTKNKYSNKDGQPFCARCQSTSNIQVHHLESAQNNKLLRFTLSNLRLLCKSCHLGKTGFHTYMGGTQVTCTKKDYLKWIKKRYKKK